MQPLYFRAFLGFFILLSLGYLVLCPIFGGSGFDGAYDFVWSKEAVFQTAEIMQKGGDAAFVVGYGISLTGKGSVVGVPLSVFGKFYSNVGLALDTGVNYMKRII